MTTPVSIRGCRLLQLLTLSKRVGNLSDCELAALLAESVLAEMSVNDPKALLIDEAVQRLIASSERKAQ